MRRATEDQIHKAIVSFLRFQLPRGSLVHHSPNEGNRGKKAGAIDGARRKAMGVHAGWPDIEFATGGRMYFLEVKSATGKISATQRATLAALETQGFECAVVRSIDDVKRFLTGCKIGGGMVKLELRGLIG